MSLRSTLFATAAIAALLSTPMASPALAQGLPIATGQIGGTGDEELLLEADELIYDYDRNVVTAAGNVQIYYGPYTLEAASITYNQNTKRVVAEGGVRITQPDGSVLTAERADVTDTLREGFVEALALRSADNTRFAANSAERIDGTTTVFTKGVYTACEPCKENPSKPPTWAIKASRIVYNQESRYVYYRDAQIEFFGRPIAYLPVFIHGGPTAERRSGFLVPNVSYKEPLGVGVTVPYYLNLAPNYDLTLRPTLYSRQGLLADAEFRHRVMNGAYSIRAAGIFQADPDAFDVDDAAAPGAFDSRQDARGAVETHGRFAINDRWNWGFDGWLMSDRTFVRNYGLLPASDTELASEIFLTGLGQRNYFDARMQHFTTLTTDIDQDKLPTVHPLIDYHNILDEPVLGGEVRLDGNLTSLTRGELDVACSVAAPDGPLANPLCAGGVTSVRGVEGTVTRLTGAAQWRRTVITDGGHVVTPFAALQADGFWTDVEPDPFLPATIETGSDVRGRITPTAGIEYRLPLVSQQAFGTQTIEPIVQIVARTDEAGIGTLPNEDAQSLVFDDTTLFEWDKFSGYDRVEGGVRANVGLSYGYIGPAGWSADGLIGQSYHLAGQNSFGESDLLNVGVESGLDSDISDIVGRASVGKDGLFRLGTRFRFDEADLSLERLELTASAQKGPATIDLGYVALAAREALGVPDDRQEVTADATLRIGEHVSTYAGARYDIDDQRAVTSRFGATWADECFSIGFGYSGSYYDDSGATADHSVSINVSLRTIGGGAYTQDIGGIVGR